MKTLCLACILVAAFAFQASARMLFISYEDLSQKEKEAWGYQIERRVGADGYASFRLRIPPKAAELVLRASVTVRDRQHQNLISFSIGLCKDKDGSSYIDIERFQDFGDVEVGIATSELPEAPFYGDVGGFTFSIPAEVKRP